MTHPATVLTVDLSSAQEAEFRSAADDPHSTPSQALQQSLLRALANDPRFVIMVQKEWDNPFIFRPIESDRLLEWRAILNFSAVVRSYREGVIVLGSGVPG